MDPYLAELYLMLLRRIQEGGQGQLSNGVRQFGMPQIPDENPPVFDAVGNPPMFLPPAPRRRRQFTQFPGVG